MATIVMGGKKPEGEKPKRALTLISSERPKITPISSTTESANLLVYGDSGAGKTVLAGSGAKTLVIACENGTISAARSGSSAQMVRAENWDTVEQTFNWLKSLGANIPFDWIWIDSLTEMQQHLIQWIIKNTRTKDDDTDIPYISEHQKWQNMFKRFVRGFNNLPVNVGYTALAMRKEDEEGETLILPDIAGKDYGMSAWTCAAMHVVGYLEVKTSAKTGNDFRRLTARRHGPYFGKDRYGTLQPYLNNPTVGSITERLESEPTKKPAKGMKALASALGIPAPANTETENNNSDTESEQ